MSAAFRPTAAQVKAMRRENQRWPVELAPIPREEWPDPNDYPGANSGSVPLGVWRSRAFVVILWLEPNGFERLSVQRTEWDEIRKRFRDGVSWDDLQRLKAEAGYGDRWAVELFPAEGGVINVANMRHLWLLKKQPPFAW